MSPCGSFLSQLSQHYVTCAADPSAPTTSFLTSVNMTSTDYGATCSFSYSCATTYYQNYICHTRQTGTMSMTSPLVLDELATQGMFCEGWEALQSFQLVNSSSSNQPGQGYFSYTCCAAVDKPFSFRKSKGSLLLAVPPQLAGTPSASGLRPGQYLLSPLGTSVCVFEVDSGNFCCYVQPIPENEIFIAYKYGCVLDDDTAAGLSISASPYKLVVTSDGMLSMYNSTGYAIWSVGVDSTHPAKQDFTCAGVCHGFLSAPGIL